jgi:hypothetical protein
LKTGYAISWFEFESNKLVYPNINITFIDFLFSTGEYPFSFYDLIAFLLFCTLFVLKHFIFIFWLLNVGYSKRRILNKQELDYQHSIIGKRSTRLKSMLYGI